MRFHTCILKGPIPFMTHSSLLISNVNCWSGILSNQKLLLCDSSQKNMHAQNFNQLPFHQSVVQLFLPSRDPYWKSHHLKISEVRLFLRNFFLCPQDPKIDQNFHQKKIRQNRGVPGPTLGLQPACGFNVSNLPELRRAVWICHFDQAPEAVSESPCGSRKKPRVSSMLIPGW